MRKVSGSLLALFTLTVLLVGSAGTASAAGGHSVSLAAPGGQSVSDPAGASNSAAERELRVGDGRVYDEFLRGAGYDEAQVRSLKRRQRAAAIRDAYAAGDAKVIAEIEAALPASVIDAALDAPEHSTLTAKNQVPSYVWYSCGAGAGVTASFRIFGSWWAYFETTSGSRTSTQTGSCSDWWNGCLVTDSVGGNPAITWRFHKMNATQYGYHGGSCN